MRKILIITFFALGILSHVGAQEVELGSFYVYFNDSGKSYTEVSKIRSATSGSRRVKSAALFPAENTNTMRAKGEEPKIRMKDYVYSMRYKDLLHNCYKVYYKGITTEAENDSIYNVLLSMPGVEKVERIYSKNILSYSAPETNMPNDPLLNLGKVDGYWHLHQIGFDKIYGKYQGNPEIKVGIIDNAIWGEHPDLQIKPENQYFAYIDETGSSAPPETLDQNEICESLGTSTCPISEWSHGTHCAGLVGAITNNAEGVASFASGVTLLTARAAINEPNNMRLGFESVLWALDRGANVLSLSWGNGNDVEAERQIIEEAVRNGVVVVAASGNSSVDSKTYPAAYEGVISVASVDSDNSRSSFSNYGKWVTIATPGGFKRADDGSYDPNDNIILSTTFSLSQDYRLHGLNEIDGLYYDGKVGTSMATPLTASVVALMLSVNPDLTPADIKQILQTTATKVDALGISENSGVINAAAAVETVAATVGTDMATVRTIGCYPNPVKDILTIAAEAQIERFELYNLSGQCVASFAQPDAAEFDLSALAEGVYLGKVVTEDGEFFSKIIKR